jgi:hypothetical protein
MVLTPKEYQKKCYHHPLSFCLLAATCENVEYALAVVKMFELRFRPQAFPPQITPTSRIQLVPYAATGVNCEKTSAGKILTSCSSLPEVESVDSVLITTFFK